MAELLGKVLVDFEMLDDSIRGVLKDMTFIKLNQVFGTECVTHDEFMQVLDGGLREAYNKEIVDYYSFLGELDIQIADGTYYENLVA